MSRLLLVLRPEPGASATATSARGMGWSPVIAPLFTVRAVAWEPPVEQPQALLLTSANAARLGGGGLAALAALPVYAVGAATAEAARRAGFTRIVAGDGDVAAIMLD
jgi:uroporphyrinogen-III synthase